MITAGLNTDNNPLYTKEGTANFCLNGVLKSTEGDYGGLVNEKGNITCISFEGYDLNGFQLIGQRRLDDNQVVLFLTDNTTSVIGLQKQDCTFELLIKSDCLNFKTHKPIDCKMRILKGCERIIYFTDFFNEYRSINIDSLNQYLVYGESVDSANTSGTGWDCSKFKHFLDYLTPKVLLNRVNDTGGNLLIGTYQFTIRYFDAQLNATNWMPLTNTVPVTIGPQNIDDITYYHNIEGGENIFEVDGVETGTVIPTSKSITLDLEGLDTRYSYYQIGVVEYVDGLRTPTNIYGLERLEITDYGTNVIDATYTYTGFNSNLHTSETLNDVLIPNLNFEKIYAHEIADDRLFFANAVEQNINWAKFQQEVCKITTGWESVGQTNQSPNTNSNVTKGSRYYFDSKSFMRDEVYAFGIVFLMSNGKTSPVFHIPGTAPDSALRLSNIATGNANPHNRQYGDTLWDRELLTVVNTPANQTTQEVALSDVEHLGLSLGETVERWKVFNTGVTTSYTPVIGNDGHTSASGLMSYWECQDALYPLVKDCEGNFVYGEDSEGNDLAGQKIRHHKFPDATLIEHGWGDVIAGGNIKDIKHSRIGIEFSNINIPVEYQSLVIGYYILHSQRDINTKTVVDKGAFNKAVINTTNIGVGSEVLYNNPLYQAPFRYYDGFAPNDDVGVLISATNTIGSWDEESASMRIQAVRGDYMKIEQVLESPTTYTFPANIGFDTSPAFGNFETPDLNLTNRKLEDSKMVASTSLGEEFSGSLYRLINNNWMNDANFLKVASAIPSLPYTANSQKCYYVAIKKNIPNVYGKLEYIKYVNCVSNYVDISNTTQLVFGGDVYINNFVYGQYDSNIPDPLIAPAFLPNDIEDEPNWRCIKLMMWEETVNVQMQHRGNGAFIEDLSITVDEKYPRLAYDDGPAAWRVIDFFLVRDEGGELVYPVRQWKALNPDFHVENKCNNVNTNTIFYSDKADSEDKKDAFKTVRISNRETVFSEDGSITNLFLEKDVLYCHTKNSLGVLQTRPQQIKLGDESEAFLGSGEVFSVPPRRLVTTKYGYAGSECKWATTSTEFGTIFVDSLQGKVFLFGSGLNEISNKGMNSYFSNNLHLHIRDLIPEYKEENYNTTEINGFGYLTAYDPQLKRFILHKKDYVVRGDITFGGEKPDVPAANTLYYYFNANEKLHWEYNNVEVFDYDSNYFINKSITLSYSLEFQVWVSWHSYMPSIMYNTSRKLFSSIISDDNIWEHGAGEYLSFYGQKFDFILDFVSKPNPSTQLYFDLQYIAYNYNILNIASGTQIIPTKEDTFTDIWCYSDNYSTDKLDLLYRFNSPLESGLYSLPSDTGIEVCKVEDTFRINQIRNLLTPNFIEPVTDSKWDSIKGSFNGVNNYQGFIDKIPNINVHDFNKNIWEVDRLRSKWLNIRLYLSIPDKNQKMVCLLFEPKTQPSSR
jgi:hypothetical protein